MSTPTTVTGTLALWLDAADPYGNGASVANGTVFGTAAQWKDKSGNARHATPNRNITYSTTGFNSAYPGFNFVNGGAGSGQYFTGSVPNTGSTLTVFTVMQIASSSTTMRPFSLGVAGQSSSAGSNAYICVVNRGGNTMEVLRSAIDSSASGVVANTPYVYDFVANGSTLRDMLHIGGSTTTIRSNASTGNFTISGYNVGADMAPDTTGTIVAGYMSEFIVYTTALSDSDRQKVEGYLSWKYGLQAKLATDHPYKSAAPTSAPGAPTALSAVAGNGQAVITFTPSSSTTAITGYQYSTDGTTYSNVASSTTTTATVTGLTNGTIYTIYLKAVNTYGAGTASSSVSVTPYTVPAAPSAAAVTPWDASALVALTAGATNGSAITSYQYSTDGGTTYATGSSTFSPTDVAGCLLWFDAADPLNTGTAPTNGTAITTWYDKSGSARDATATGTITFSTTGLNSKPALVFTNSNTQYLSGSVSNTNTTMTIFVMMNMNATAHVGARAIAMAATGQRSDTNSGYMGFLRQTGNGVQGYRNAVSTGNNPASIGVPYLFETWYDGTTNYNTVQQGSATAITSVASSGNFNVSSFAIARGTATSEVAYFIGSISEVIVYNTALTTAQRQSVEGYISWKWGLQTNLPSSHPYYSASPTAAAVSPSFTISGLTNSTAYNLYFKAVNAAGASAALSGGTVMPLAAAVPDAPTALVATAGSTQLSVAFTVGAINRAYITNYQYSTNGGTSFTACSPAQTTSPVVITGLTNGTTYTIQLKAVNSAGVSAASASATGTPATTPGAPTSLVATGGDSQVYLTFVAPASNGGSAITNYQYSTNNGSTFIALSPASTALLIAIPSLTNGTSYTIVLKAVNAIGAGTASASVVSTPAGAFTSPTSVTGCALWFDASDIYGNSAVVANGTAISTWYDKSGNGKNVAAGYGTPTYNVNGLATGYKAVAFNNNSILRGNTSITGKGLTIFAVTTLPSTGNSNRLLSLNATTSIAGHTATSSMIMLRNTTSLALSGYRNGQFIGSPAVPTFGLPYLFETWYDSADGTNYNVAHIGGSTTSSASVVTGTNANGNFAANYIAIGADYPTGAAGAENWAGNVSEIVIYNVTLSTTDRQKVEGYLSWKWGLQANLATDHPYKSAAPSSVTAMAPTGLSATAGNGQAVINFTPGGSSTTITNYQYSTDGTTYANVASFTTTTATVTGLTNGTTYTIYLKAVNTYGAGTASTGVAATPYTVPAAPTAAVVTPWDASALVALTAGATNGSAITNYQYSTDGGTTYTTSATTFTPTSVSGCLLWFDAADPLNTGTAPTNGAAITTWYDKSGSARNATATGTITFSTTGLNSKPAVVFNNSNTQYLVGSVPLSTASLTIFVVMKMESTTHIYTRALALGAPGQFAATSNSYMFFGRLSGNGIQGQRNSVYAANNPASIGVPYLFETWFDGTTNYNTVQQGASTTITSVASSGNFNISSFCIGRDTLTTSGEYFIGAMSEILVYNTALTTTQRQSVEGYLSWKWGLQTNLPSAHPYYSASPSSVSSSPSFTVSSLTNGTAYNLYFKAVNAAGAGAALSGGTVTPLAAAAPDAPTSLVATVGGGQLSIAFTAGAVNRSYITNYQYSTNGGTSFTACSPAVTVSPVVITGLTNGTTYTVQLKAVNSVGAGAASASVTGTPYSTPGAPTSLVATAGNGQVSLAFVAPASNGGTAITNYSYSIDNGATYTTQSPASTTSPIVISNLTNGTPYTIMLKAINAIGAGTASASVVSTPVGVFISPTAVTGCALWFDASDIYGNSAVLANGTAVSTWYDKSGNNRNAILKFGTLQYYANGLATGYPACYFNQTQGLKGNVSITGKGLTIFAVTTVINQGGSNRLLALSPDGGVAYTSTNAMIFTRLGGTSITGWRNSVNNSGPSPPAYNTPYLFETWYDSANGTNYNTVHVGGSTTVTASVATSNVNFGIQYFGLGTEYSNGGAGSECHAGYLSEIIVYNNTLSTTDRQKIEGYMAWKWGLQAKLATDHPYKNSAPTSTTASAPTGLSVTSGNTQIVIAFTPGGSSSTITNYQYSTDGTTYANVASFTTTTATITGLTNGTAYTIYLKAVNGSGAGTASTGVAATPYTTPGAPTSLVATVGDSQVSVAFTAPASTGGSALTNYSYSTDNGVTYTVRSPTATTSPIVITGLTNGTAYTILLKAINAGGAGTASASVSATPLTTPGAPTGLAATAGDGQVSLAFVAPASTGGSALTNYSYSTDGGTTYTVRSPASTTSPIAITGLTNSTSYTIRLKAVNALGAGTASTSVSVMPISSNTTTVPGAPTSLVATASSGQVSLAFVAPASTGGSAITNYAYSTNGGTSYTTVSTALSVSPIVISGLTNGTTYTILLKAVNAIGSGTASASVTATPFSAPAAPSALVATAGDGQVSVAFTAGSANGSAITNYVYSIDGGSTYSAFSPAQTASPVVVSGLTNSTAYYIKLAAVNGVGIGSVSGSVVATPIAVGPPLPPTSLSSTAANGAVQIAFAAGFSHGDTLTNYMYSIDAGATYTAFSPAQTTAPLTISGLTNGTTYTVSLKAVSARGTSTASASVSAAPASPPGAPAALVAVPGRDKATVVFVADGVARNYAYSLDGGATYAEFMPAQDASPVVIEGLVNGTTYSINLKGINAYGTGPAATTAATVKPGTAPGAPSNLVPTVSDSSVSIAFDESPLGGYPITSHQYSLDGGVTYTSFYPAQASSPVVITGLTNGTRYTVQLKAINLLGIGPGSRGVPVVPAGVSGVPTGLVVSATSNTTATLAFTAGTAAGGTITNYMVSTDGGSNFAALSPAYTGSPIPLSGLTPGATYSIVLKEVTTGGTSAASAAVSLQLTVPDAVTGLSATTETEQTTVSFTSTSPPGAAVTNYAYSLDGGNNYTVFSPAQTASPVSITGLTDGVSYTIRLKAVNALGTSATGDSVVITPVSPATEPDIVAVDATATITLATTYNGDTVVKYWYSIDNGVNWIDPTNTITIENLSNGVDYSMWYFAVTYTGNSPTFVANVSPVQGAASAPTITGITPATDGSTLAVAFTDPTSTGTSAITNYTYTINNGLAYTVFSPAQTVSPLTIGNTALGNTYYVAIAAINSSGVGDTSSMVSVLTFVPCFARGTKIRTDKGYRSIETLRRGDMVQTLEHAYVAIHTIGRRAVIPARDAATRTPNHLYRCSPNVFEEVFEDLVMTGYHAALQPSLLPPMEAKVRALYNGKVFITEDMYRVPICLDERATVFIPPGDTDTEFEIFNFALEAKDRYTNYGVYANGLLVESSSIRYMTELAGMNRID